MTELTRLRFGTGAATPMSAALALSPNLWVKDDGAFGTGPWGGNKVRKLEYTLADARRRGKRTVLTVGGYGTNHGLATALYARELGMRCILCLAEQPEDDHVREMSERIDASGAEVHRFPDKRGVARAVAWNMVRHRPYYLPVGGSSPLGVLGAADCGGEIAMQLDYVRHVVVAAGSGGTAAGLMVGLAAMGCKAEVVAVLVNDKTPLDHGKVVALARRAAKLLPIPPKIEERALRWETEWLGEGYGHATPEGQAAAALARERLGLDLDPVYTAKAMAALLALRERGELDGPTIFLQTNGPRPAA